MKETDGTCHLWKLAQITKKSFWDIAILSFFTHPCDFHKEIKHHDQPWVWHSRKVGPSPGILTPSVPQDPKDHRNRQHLWNLGPTGISGLQDPWEITSTFWNSESKHPETLKLKHKQRTFLNYIIEQSKRKIACTFWGCFIYRVVNNDY